MIEEKKICRRRKIRESPGDRALALGVLVRVSEIKLTALEELRRTRRQLQCTNARAFNGQGKEDVRVAQRVVIEEEKIVTRIIVGVCLILSFFAPLISINVSASSATTGAMVCCIGKSSGHCSAGLLRTPRPQLSRDGALLNSQVTATGLRDLQKRRLPGFRGQSRFVAGLTSVIPRSFQLL
jgi:hypothetical protein